MKLSKALNASLVYTGKASDSSRQLSFAGIAAVWLLGGNVLKGVVLVASLKWALLFFALSLLFDLLHYCLGGIIWKAVYEFGRTKVVSETDDPDIKSDFLNWPLYGLYAFKILLVMAGYGFIIGHLIQSLGLFCGF